MEYLYPLVLYWGAEQWLMMLVGAVFLCGVLWCWSCIWDNVWVRTHKSAFAGCVLLALLPLVLVMHSHVGAALVENEAGLRAMERQVQRESNRAMVSFFRTRADRADFVDTVVQEYARHLYEKQPHTYLPVQQWTPAQLPDEVRSILKSVRPTLHLSEHEMNSVVCDQLFAATCRYTAQLQQIQNAKRLMQGFPWLSVFLPCLLVAMALLVALPRRRRRRQTPT